MANAPLDALGDRKAQAQQAVNAALASAKTMLGKNEVPNKSELQQYLHDGGQDLDPHKLAWCAAFVSASLQKAGLPVPTQVVKGSAFGPGAYAPNYLTYGSAVEPKNIQAGDILVANNGTHVGFAEGPTRQGPNGPEAQLLAGNEQDPSGQYAPGSYTSPTGAVAKRAQVGMVGERWVPLSQYSARRYQPTDAQDASPAAAPAGTTINTTAQPGRPMTPTPAPANTFETMRNNIAQFESGNDYNILGPTLKNGDYAIGKYQVMSSNVPNWTQKWLGKSMTADEFRADPQAQEAVFKGEFGSYLQTHTPADAASMWFSGKPVADAGKATDVLGTSVPKYVAVATKGLDNPNAAPPGPPVATAVASAAPAGGIGTTINSLAGTSDNPSPFMQGASELEKGLAGQAPGQGQDQGAPQVRPVSIAQPPPPHMPSPQYGQQLYGTTLNSMQTPLNWGTGQPNITGRGPASPYASQATQGGMPVMAGTPMAAGVPQGATLEQFQQMQQQAQQQALMQQYGAAGGLGGLGGMNYGGYGYG